ncbi:MAG: T9SS type A sorting domain-containing protein [Bacteroidota bacterium]
MKNLKKTLLTCLMTTTFYLSVFAAWNNVVVNGVDTLLIPVEGNWPNMPPFIPFCYDLQAPDYEFGFGMNVHTAGLLTADHPPLFATFNIDVHGQGPVFTHHVPITNADLVFQGVFNGYEIYSFYASYFEGFGFICPTNHQEIQYSFSLTTDLGGGFHVPYPVANFTGPGEIFSSEVFAPGFFEETGEKCFSCDSALPNKYVANDYSEMETGFESLSRDGNESVRNTSLSLHKNSVKVYPNPFSTTIELSLDFIQPALVEYEILDVNGIPMRSGESYIQGGRSFQPVDLSSLKNGIYFIRTTVGNEVNVKKIFKSDL